MADEDLTKRLTRAIWALRNPLPSGSVQYQGGWEDALEAAIDVVKDELLKDSAALHPRRDDAFAAWLKTQRDASANYPEAYQAADGLLDLYRLHADTGTPLSEHVCERASSLEDCDCLEGTVADYTGETVTRTIRRWIVPAAEPWGAAHAEIGKAWSAAEMAYRLHHNIPKDKPLSDDALWFHVRDDEIVIEFSYETPAADTVCKLPHEMET
jgi:hypothetical protein